MQNKSIKFTVTEQFAGTRDIKDIFTDIIVSDLNEKEWILAGENVKIDSPTIPESVVPERSI